MDAAAQLRPYVPELLLHWPSGSARQRLDGTLVSADISGFTALSERLAGKGREGAEELTVLINSCFAGMIDDCRREGGDIIKFGGDALLVFFDGDGHAQRACRAAVAMRNTIKRPRRTSDGKRVGLKVSTGVHSGLHDFYVVAGSHLELLVTGPGTTNTVDVESAANAGEILLSAPTAALLPASWLGAGTPAGVLLSRTYGRHAAQHVSAPVTRAAAEFVPVEQQAQILANAANEHRQVAISFVEFAGTDQLDPDDLAARLQQLATSLAEICNRLGVYWLATDVYHDGGKFILAAGAPISQGGDEDRMLRAVRELIDADPGLSLRAGVNRGYVFAGDLGSQVRRTYTVMGDAMNLAARLMAKAEPGEVVVSRPMVDWASSNFEYAAMEPFMVKGKSMAIYAGKLGRLIGRRSDLDRIDTELCGRAAEVELLLGRADAARAGRGSVTVITGEPGIGKTRLALEVIRQRGDLTVAFARCQPYDRLTAYAVTEPLIRGLMNIALEAEPRDAGEQLLSWLAAIAPAISQFAPLVAVAIGAEVPDTAEAAQVAPEFRRVRTQQLLVELLQTAIVSPVAVMVDDINLADDATRELLQALVDATAAIPLLVMATSTPDEALVPDPVQLLPLAGRDVHALLDVLIGDRAVGADTVREIVARSGGNPLFIGELVRSLAEDPLAALPASLEALVSTRIDALDPADRQLLRQASVMGSEVDIEMLGRALGDGLIRRQDRWERLHRFLEWAGPGVVRFRYDTYWRVVYSGLSFATRRNAHRRVIEILEDDLDADDHAMITLLAAHAERAGDASRTWRYASAAATHAAQVSSFGEAARLFAMALVSPPADIANDERAVFLEAASESFVRAGRFADAQQALARVSRLVSDQTVLARIMRRRGDLFEQSGESLRAERAFRSARHTWATLEWSTDLAERARLDVAEAALAYRRRQYERAWQLAARALVQSQLSEDWPSAARAAHLIDNVVINVRWSGAALARPPVRELYQRAGDLVGEARHINNLAVDLYFDGGWDEAARLYREAAEQCSKSGDVVYEATALNNIAEILSDQGRYGDAESLLRTASRSWRSVGFATGIALADANLGRLATRQGQYESATLLLQAAIERFERLGAAGFVLESRLRLAENGLLGGDATQVAALRPADDWDANLAIYAKRLIAIAHLGAGRVEAAKVAIADSIAQARSADIPFELAQSLLAADLIDGAATPANDEAATIFDGLGVVQRPPLPALPAPSVSRAARSVSSGR